MPSVIDAQQALRGVSLIVAVTMIAELDDLAKFDHHKKLMVSPEYTVPITCCKKWPGVGVFFSY
jgi:hypothetical protein